MAKTQIQLGSYLSTIAHLLSQRSLLIFLSGLLMGLAPAPLNAWPLAFLALVPLWVVLLSSASHAATSQTQSRFLLWRYPLLWGLGYHGLALSWITYLHPLTWMGIPWIGSLAIALFAWGFITLWGAALVMIWFGGLRWLYFGSKSLPMAAWFRILAATALWCSLETVWSWGPLYWTSLSYTQSPGNLALLHLGQLSGQFTVTAVIVAFNGCLAEAWVSRRQASSSQPRLLILAATGLMLTSYLVGYGLKWSAPADNPQQLIRAGLIQGNVPTRIKLTPAGERQAIAGYTQGYLNLVNQGVDLVITPEGALPLIWRQPVPSQNPLYQAVLQRQVPLWLGTFAIAENSNPVQLTQSLLAIDGSGKTVGRYNKVKLVPLGEYIPFESILGRLIQRLSSLEGSLKPGDNQQRFNTSFGPVAVGICYESAYGEIFRHQVAGGGQLLVMVSNNDPYPPYMMAQDHAQDVMRAIETDRWAIRVTNTGLSGIVDAHGHTLWLSEPNRYMLHAASVYRRRSQTLYVRWGNWLTPALLLAATLCWVQQRFSLPTR
ncbi:apolipoprotein N-acyltransferase [Almyronema epifaneia]|uniref:Apolipoprotein N-acyltransferase n=1 Tax=Almyronema epifaneia S1 TaxID=2991925 RepID=A0ABW6IBP3_9CYAN